ncbi:hypothetical protein SUDANB180_04738 [Streptomyces sp. enrichment culture]
MAPAVGTLRRVPADPVVRPAQPVASRIASSTAPATAGATTS